MQHRALAGVEQLHVGYFAQGQGPVGGAVHGVHLQPHGFARRVGRPVVVHEQLLGQRLAVVAAQLRGQRIGRGLAPRRAGGSKLKAASSGERRKKRTGERRKSGSRKILASALPYQKLGCAVVPRRRQSAQSAEVAV